MDGQLYMDVGLDGWIQGWDVEMREDGENDGCGMMDRWVWGGWRNGCGVDGGMDGGMGVGWMEGRVRGGWRDGCGVENEFLVGSH